MTADEYNAGLAQPGGLTPEESQRAYDEAVPEPVSEERVREIVEYATRLGKSWRVGRLKEDVADEPTIVDDSSTTFSQGQCDMLSARYHRRIIQIKATDSPNVRLGELCRRYGRVAPSDPVLEGVLSDDEYRARRATWSPVRQCIGLDAEFYEGAEDRYFPREWLERAHVIWEVLPRNRVALGIGIDPGEGTSSTSMCAVDGLGVIELVSRKTPNTDDIPREALMFMNRHHAQPERVCFDRGGGGKQHADRLRSLGYNVRTVAFGESLVPDPKRGINTLADRKENREERYVYFNRRAEMYGEVSLLLDPGYNERGWGVPPGSVGPVYEELLRQLAPMPKVLDAEGRFKMLPKNKRAPDSPEPTLVELLGCSPDEADALVLAVYAMQNTVRRAVAGAL